ncbi:TetR/AcrR family transcriptional regulator [Henriciella sp. AS95]|uniref:TetR/AcrR family transcriptional regulator n=1 Tax=Henriciella sp. AS95 TaxID=3135782 RepID=UPI00317DFDB3
MATGTREKIVETARQLFNRLHYGNVTTAMLAEAAGISEGNLWYHFKTKRDLLEAITDDFLEQNAARLSIWPDHQDVLGSYVTYLASLAHELRQFRFLYRDQADYGEHTDALNKALPDIYAGSREGFCAFFRAMQDKGMLDIDDAEIGDLAVNAILVLRYTLEYLRECGQADTEGSGAVAGGIRQHLTLFSHRLSPAARLELERQIAALENGRLKNRDASVMNAQ